MKKHLVLCFSKTGNSKFIAEKLAKALQCDVEMIQPSVNGTGLLFILSLLNIPVSVNISNERISQYQEVVIIGPIWGGRLIAPLKAVLKKCIALKKPVHFAVTCETKESDKDGSYGYAQVLNKAKALGGDLVRSTTAFSTSLIIGYDDKIKTNLSVKAKFTDDNFSEALRTRFEDMKNKVTMQPQHFMV